MLLENIFLLKCKGINLVGPFTAWAQRHVPYVPQWWIRPCFLLSSSMHMVLQVKLEALLFKFAQPL